RRLTVRADSREADLSDRAKERGRHPPGLRRGDDRDADLDAGADEGSDRALGRGGRGGRPPQEGRLRGPARGRRPLGRQRRSPHSRRVRGLAPEDGMTRFRSRALVALAGNLRSPALALLAGLLATPLFAHDFWIESSTFRPPPGSTVGLRLMVGQGFHGEPVPRNPALIVKFELVSASGEAPVPGLAADDPAGTVPITAAGLQEVGYRSGDSFVSLDARTVEDELHAEGVA